METNTSKTDQPCNEIVLIRHGETRANVEGILQGGTHDTEITSIGRMQAQNIFARFCTAVFDGIYFSPMRRVLTTMEIMLLVRRDKYAPLELREELREQSFGIYAGKMKVELPTELLMERSSVGKWYYRWMAGESMRDVHDRLLPMANLLSESTGKICVVAHETVNCILVGMLCDMTPLVISNLSQANNEILFVKDGSLRKEVV